MSPTDPPNDEPRGLSAPLLFAILAIPPVFVWLLLRPGFSPDLRIGAFLYAFLLPTIELVALLIAAAAGR